MKAAAIIPIVLLPLILGCVGYYPYHNGSYGDPYSYGHYPGTAYYGIGHHSLFIHPGVHGHKHFIHKDRFDRHRFHPGARPFRDGRKDFFRHRDRSFDARRQGGGRLDSRRDQNSGSGRSGSRGDRSGRGRR